MVFLEFIVKKLLFDFVWGGGGTPLTVPKIEQKLLDNLMKKYAIH